MSILETQRQIERTEDHLRHLRHRLVQETVAQHQQSREPPDPEVELKFYRWPATRITRADMIRLTELRAKTRKPITQLLHEAIAAYYSLFSDLQ